VEIFGVNKYYNNIYINKNEIILEIKMSKIKENYSINF
jgi:hypothetical protein